MENIDVVFYINLQHRTDRNGHYLEEIKKLCPDTSKVVRIDAIYNKVGPLGCTSSFIKAYDTFIANPAWKTALFCEDDLSFFSDSVIDNNIKLRQAMEAFPDWEVINLTYNPKGLDYLDTHVAGVKKVLKTQTCSGFCVKKPFIAKLRENFAIVADLNRKEGLHSYTCCDNSWRVLQPDAKWYTLYPAIGYQYACFSDNEQMDVDYKC